MVSSNPSYHSMECVRKWGNWFIIFDLSENVYKTFFLYIYSYLFELIFGLLTLGDKGVRVSAGLFLRSKILWYAQNFRWVLSPTNKTLW